MGVDKGLISYHGQPQRYFAFELLLPFCRRVYLSCSAAQFPSISEAYPALADSGEYANAGPMTALLTAQARFPSVDFCLLGCDYPLLSAKELTRFFNWVESRAGEQKDRPVAFYNEAAGKYEPLLAYYPAASATLLRDRYTAKEHSLQHFLQAQRALRYLPSDAAALFSADTPGAVQYVQQLLAARTASPGNEI